MDDSSDRESYCLSAGLALGMVCLGQGEQVVVADSRCTTGDVRAPRTLTDTLYHYMTGGAKRPLTGTLCMRRPYTVDVKTGGKKSLRLER
jgi:anaphase-promoting complex subunit 1